MKKSQLIYIIYYFFISITLAHGSWQRPIVRRASNAKLGLRRPLTSQGQALSAQMRKQGLRTLSSMATSSRFYSTVTHNRDKRENFVPNYIEESKLIQKSPFMANIYQQNYRPYQEDHYFIQPYQRNGLLIGVFDGHGAEAGDTVSSFLKYFIPRKLAEYLDEGQDPRNALAHSIEEAEDEIIKMLELRNLPFEGSTLTVSYICGKKLYVAQVGDSPAFICRYNSCQLLTQADHTPNNPVEAERIKGQGGYITEDFFGYLRVNDMLAMSRSIGVSKLKEYGVSGKAEIFEYEINPSDYALVMGSDGLFENHTIDEIDAFIRASKTPKQAVKKIQESIMLRKTQDNTTVLVIQLFNLSNEIKNM